MARFFLSAATAFGLIVLSGCGPQHDPAPLLHLEQLPVARSLTSDQFPYAWVCDGHQTTATILLETSSYQIYALDQPSPQRPNSHFAIGAPGAECAFHFFSSLSQNRLLPYLISSGQTTGGPAVPYLDPDYAVRVVSAETGTDISFAIGLNRLPISVPAPRGMIALGQTAAYFVTRLGE